MPSVARKPLPQAVNFGAARPSTPLAFGHGRPPRQWLAGAALLLGTLVFVAFSPALKADFIGLDDPLYVVQNPLVLRGLSLRGLCQAVTSFHAYVWNPLTWISLMLDTQIFGHAPFGYHLTNLILHAFNAMLLAYLLYRMTGCRWRSFLAASLFALHPLRVESVVWVTERKDVLSLFLGLATLLAYVRYARAPRARNYAHVLILFAASLMAKQMLVTLPLILLLVDYWPLRRFARSTPTRASADGNRGQRLRRLLLEKTPLLLLSAIATGLAIAAAGETGRAPEDARPVPGYNVDLPMRLSNAAISYVRYLHKSLAFGGLIPYYTYPSRWPAWQVAAALTLIVATTSAVILLRRRYPAALVGWGWFVIGLLPMIGIVQAGAQSIADRFTYFPAIGLSLMVCWTVPQPSTRRQFLLATATASLVIALLGVFTFFQTRLWRDDFTLFGHTLEVAPGNWMAESQLACAMVNLHKCQPAIPLFERSLRSNPYQPITWNTYGFGLNELGDQARAEECYRRSIETDPSWPLPHNNLGVLLLRRGDPQGAKSEFQLAILIEPGNVEARTNLGVIAAQQNRFDEAIAHFQAILSENPGFTAARINLGMTLERAGQSGEAISQFKKAIELDPASASAHCHLGTALARAGRLDDAIMEFHAALDLDPKSEEATIDLDRAQAARQRRQPG